MNSTLKNILAVMAGAILGSFVNMAIVMFSGHVIPPPDGADITTTEGLQASMHLFQPRHFIFPFLAHAIGTFCGAWLCAKIAANRKMLLACIVGVLFLAGGLMMVISLPSPMWFSVLDLVGAYLPMAFIAAKLTGDQRN